jgi:hypothetical protein
MGLIHKKILNIQSLKFFFFIELINNIIIIKKKNRIEKKRKNERITKTPWRKKIRRK